MTDVVVYGIPLSTFVRSVRMALEEKGVRYDVEPLEPHAEKLNALHPYGKVPAFRHKDVSLFETLAICSYVDEAFPGPALAPKDAAGRARMLQWIGAYNDNFYPATVRLVIQRLVVPMKGGTPDEGAIRDSLPSMEKSLAVFDRAVAGGPWLAGNAFSLADMFPAPMVFYLKMTPEGEQALSRFKNFTRWYEKVAARPSFKATEPKFG